MGWETLEGQAGWSMLWRACVLNFNQGKEELWEVEFEGTFRSSQSPLSMQAVHNCNIHSRWLLASACQFTTLLQPMHGSFLYQLLRWPLLESVSLGIYSSSCLGLSWGCAFRTSLFRNFHPSWAPFPLRVLLMKFCVLLPSTFLKFRVIVWL